jgi:hypothetical protein
MKDWNLYYSQVGIGKIKRNIKLFRLQLCTREFDLECANVTHGTIQIIRDTLEGRPFLKHFFQAFESEKFFLG